MWGTNNTWIRLTLHLQKSNRTLTLGAPTPGQQICTLDSSYQLQRFPFLLPVLRHCSPLEQRSSPWPISANRISRQRDKKGQDASVCVCVLSQNASQRLLLRTWRNSLNSQLWIKFQESEAAHMEDANYPLNFFHSAFFASYTGIFWLGAYSVDWVFPLLQRHPGHGHLQRFNRFPSLFTWGFSKAFQHSS